MHSVGAKACIEKITRNGIRGAGYRLATADPNIDRARDDAANSDLIDNT